MLSSGHGTVTHKLTAAVVVHTRSSQRDQSSILTGNSNGTQWVIEEKIKGEDMKLRIFRGIFRGRQWEGEFRVNRNDTYSYVCMKLSNNK